MLYTVCHTELIQILITIVLYMDCIHISLLGRGMYASHVIGLILKVKFGSDILCNGDEIVLMSFFDNFTLFKVIDVKRCYLRQC